MVDTLLSDVDLAALNLEDADIRSIEWTGIESPNLRIVLHRSSESTTLLFTWVNRLRINLDLKRFRANIARLRFDRTLTGRRCVLFDFAGDGSIEFECEAVFHEPSRTN